MTGAHALQRSLECGSNLRIHTHPVRIVGVSTKICGNTKFLSWFIIKFLSPLVRLLSELLCNLTVWHPWPPYCITDVEHIWCTNSKGHKLIEQPRYKTWNYIKRLQRTYYMPPHRPPPTVILTVSVKHASNMLGGGDCPPNVIELCWATNCSHAGMYLFCVLYHSIRPTHSIACSEPRCGCT